MTDDAAIQRIKNLYKAIENKDAKASLILSDLEYKSPGGTPLDWDLWRLMLEVPLLKQADWEWFEKTTSLASQGSGSGASTGKITLFQVYIAGIQQNVTNEISTAILNGYDYEILTQQHYVDLLSAAKSSENDAAADAIIICMDTRPPVPIPEWLIDIKKEPENPSRLDVISMGMKLLESERKIAKDVVEGKSTPGLGDIDDKVKLSSGDIKSNYDLSDKLGMTFNGLIKLNQLLGPPNMIEGLNDDDPCTIFGGCRPMICIHRETQDIDDDLDEIDPDEDWFTGVCDICNSAIATRSRALRRALVEGGYIGCYDTEDCRAQARKMASIDDPKPVEQAELDLTLTQIIKTVGQKDL